MKTDNIYFATLALTTKVNYIGDLSDYFYGPGIIKRTTYKDINLILVRVTNNICGEAIAKDLNTNKKYKIALACDKGKLFIPSDSLLSFDAVYKGQKKNLSKRKVLKLGNDAIKAVKEHHNEKIN